LNNVLDIFFKQKKKETKSIKKNGKKEKAGRKKEDN
jgi:hypothetical protein